MRIANLESTQADTASDLAGLPFSSDMMDDISPMDMDTMIPCDDPRNFANDLTDVPESILAEWENAKSKESNVSENDLKDDEDILNEALASLPRSTRELLNELRFKPSYIGKVQIPVQEEVIDTKEDLSEYVSDNIKDKLLAESDIAELESEEAYE